MIKECLLSGDDIQHKKERKSGFEHVINLAFVVVGEAVVGLQV